MNSKIRFAVLLTIVSLFLAHPAVAAPLKSLSGHVPKIVSRLQSTGKLDETTPLKLAIGLPLHNQGALSNFVAALYDPKSPQYHHYLTSEQFVAQFGPTQGEYDSVVTFAKASGFTITATHDDRMMVEVSGKSADIERAFNINMRLYPHPTENRTFYAPDAEPSVPNDLPIADICGLNTYLRPKPLLAHRRVLGRADGPQADKTVSVDGSGATGNFLGSDYRQIYLPGVTNTGTGQTVGVFEFDNYYPSDITAFKTLAKITNAPTVTAQLLNGYNGAQSDGNGEVALDIEMIMSFAPGVTEIISYEASTNDIANTILEAMANATSVKQFSCSWSFGSNPQTTMDSYFIRMQSQGQSFYAASGDYGAYTDGLPEPDDDPYITLVGGTAVLTSSVNGAWMGENVWNAPDYEDSSSGGVSSFYTIPYWQVGVATDANGASDTFRNTPDVAAVADNIEIVADAGHTESTGGTSAAAPLWAAFTAIANQYAASLGQSSVGFINPAIYSLYGQGNNPAYGATFDDITFGNDTNYIPQEYFATPGYDLCTGLGSPIGSSLLISLVSPDDFTISSGRGFTASGPIGGPYTFTNQVLTLLNSGVAPLNWAVGATPAWLTVSGGSGTLSAGGSQSVPVSLTSSAYTLAVGVYTANLSFTNLTSGQVQTRQFAVQVGQNAIHDGGFEAGDFAYWVLSGADTYGFDFVDYNGGDTGAKPEGGNYFAAFGQVEGEDFLIQQFPTVPGLKYLLSYWMENPSGETPNEFTVLWADSATTNTLRDSSNLGKSAWTIYYNIFTATDTNTEIQFGAYDSPAALVLDEVTVKPIPLPTITAFSASASSVSLTWYTLAGMQYQVQEAPTLSPDSWTVARTITASANTTTVTLATPGGAQEFYRVVMLPTVP